MGQGVVEPVTEVDPANLFKVTPSTQAKPLGEMLAKALVDTSEVVLQTVGPEGLNRAVKGLMAANPILAAHGMVAASFFFWQTVPGSRGEPISAIFCRVKRYTFQAV